MFISHQYEGATYDERYWKAMWSTLGMYPYNKSGWVDTYLFNLRGM